MRVLLLIFLTLFFLFSGCINEEQEIPEEEEQETPKETRSYYLGIVPTPKTTPEIDITGAYEETGEICEIVEIWVEPSTIGAYDSLVRNQAITGARVYSLKVIVNMNFYTIEEVPGEGLQVVVNAPTGYEKNLSNPEFREAYISDAKKIAEEFHPEYFSLGNEVTAYYITYPEDFDNFVSLYNEAYDEIKSVSPETKVFVVFSQNQMEGTETWNIIDKFGDKLDLLVFTTYPWKFYDKPEDIPDDYYSKLETYTTKPVAFTEIGWPSDTDAGSSEKEQAEYLLRFVELTNGTNVEFINWLFLHETEISGTMASISDPATGTIALKKSDGTLKEVYYIWLDLKNLEKD